MLLLEDKLTKALNALETLKYTFSGNVGTYENDDNEDLCWDIRSRLSQYGVECSVFCGASKLCILIDGCSEVIKIPFEGYWCEEFDEEWDDEDTYEEFHHYKWANDDICCDGASSWDYCENELIKYERAEAAGFDKLFPRTEFARSIQGHPIYVQERVTPLDTLTNERYRSLVTKDNTNRYKEFSKNKSYGVGGSLGGMLIAAYGEEMVDVICKFLNDEHMDEDLHSANVGVNAAGLPVILDFSGWRD